MCVGWKKMFRRCYVYVFLFGVEGWLMLIMIMVMLFELLLFKVFFSRLEVDDWVVFFINNVLMIVLFRWLVKLLEYSRK